MLTSLAALLTAKTAAAAVAVTYMGGVALAATTGVLPTPLADSPGAQQVQREGNGAAVRDGAARGAAAGAAGAAKAVAAAENGTEKADRADVASFAGLCNAFAAGAWDHGKAADSAAFSVLVAAAGSKADVATFCDAVDAAETATSPGRAGDTAERGNSAAAHERAEAAKARSTAAREAAAEKAAEGRDRAAAGAENATEGQDRAAAGAENATERPEPAEAAAPDSVAGARPTR